MLSRIIQPFNYLIISFLNNLLSNFLLSIRIPRIFKLLSRNNPTAPPVFGQWRIYMISMGSMVIGSNMLQSHLLSTTTMKRLLLGICWITKDLPITAQTAIKTKRGVRKRRGGVGDVKVGLASRQGAWLWCKFPCVSEDLCYECSHSPLAERRRTEETTLDGCQGDDLSHRQLSINRDVDRRTTIDTHIKYTGIFL